MTAGDVTGVDVGRLRRDLKRLRDENEDTGLDDVEIDDSLTYLLTFVRASSRDTQAAQDAIRDSGMDDQQWWASAGPS